MQIAFARNRSECGCRAAQNIQPGRIGFRVIQQVADIKPELKRLVFTDFDRITDIGVGSVWTE